MGQNRHKYTELVAIGEIVRENRGSTWIEVGWLVGYWGYWQEIP